MVQQAILQILWALFAYASKATNTMNGAQKQSTINAVDVGVIWLDPLCLHLYI